MDVYSIRFAKEIVTYYVTIFGLPIFGICHVLRDKQTGT